MKLRQVELIKKNYSEFEIYFNPKNSILSCQIYHMMILQNSILESQK